MSLTLQDKPVQPEFDNINDTVKRLLGDSRRMPSDVTMGATCPACGSTNSRFVKVEDEGVVVRTYFECGDCGNIW